LRCPRRLPRFCATVTPRGSFFTRVFPSLSALGSRLMAGKPLSRRLRRALRRAERRPPRPVPADLRGRCFNCFSPGHRAAACKTGTRCFHCREVGHRSYTCPSRCPSKASSATRRLMWWPVSGHVPAAAAMVAHAPGGSSEAPVEHGAGDPPARRRHRVRKRRCNRPPSPSAPEISNGSPSVDEEARQSAAGEGARRPRRPILRSTGRPLISHAFHSCYGCALSSN